MMGAKPALMARPAPVGRRARRGRRRHGCRRRRWGQCGRRRSDEYGRCRGATSAAAPVERIRVAPAVRRTRAAPVERTRAGPAVRRARWRRRRERRRQWRGNHGRREQRRRRWHEQRRRRRRERRRGGASGASGGGAGGQTLPPLFAYYPFDQTAGPTIPDASGNGHGGTLAGTATFPAAVIGNGLSLPGVSGDYVALPGALLQTVTNVTIALWVNVRADQAWQRVFDFGSSTNVYMFLTPHAGGTSIARFAITTSGNATANEQRLDAPASCRSAPGRTWRSCSEPAAAPSTSTARSPAPTPR